MKETYISPELTCMCLAPTEAVARLVDGFDEYLEDGKGNAVSTDDVIIDPDVDIDITFP